MKDGIMGAVHLLTTKLNFMGLSKAGVGAAMLVLEQVMFLFGFSLPEGTITNATDAIWTLVGFATLVWGQLDRKDLKYGIVRR